MFYNYYFGIYTMLPLIILSLIVQSRLNSTYSKYSRISNSRGMTGGQMAEMILRRSGIMDVSVTCINGRLSDHFDPAQKVIRLSEEVYNGNTIAAIGVAAHECGHAIQYHVDYFPIKLRASVVGITNFSSKFLYFLILASLFINVVSISSVIFNLAILCYAIIFFFQLVTLPVEFNASSRAVEQIAGNGFSEEEVKGVKKVLSAAAMTYVASAITALVQLLAMISRSRRR
ncbi:MAG: zinc metallopeptidase [Clostridia bacterium]|nr:zinc metallopeptidase [Clostridia bacterium]